MLVKKSPYPSLSPYDTSFADPTIEKLISTSFVLSELSIRKKPMRFLQRKQQTSQFVP